MRGYIQNEGTQAYFVCQRQIPPGGKVQLEDVYKSVGKKSGLEENIEFVKWVQVNIFTRGPWGYYEEEGKKLQLTSKNSAPQKTTARKTPVNNKTSSKQQSDARGAGRALRRNSDQDDSPKPTPSAIIEAPYDQARGLIEKTRDRVVLKKALNLTKHFAGKEQHMRHIIKQLDRIY